MMVDFVGDLESKQVRQGVHLNAAGGDRPGKIELDPEILQRPQTVVEFTEQTRVEGEIQLQSPDYPVADFSASRYLRDMTRNTAYATQLDLVADPEDPKDLFGLIPSMSPVG